MMNKMVIQRVAAGLAGAYSQALRQHEYQIRALRVRGGPAPTGRRVGRRPGCAAEKFEREMEPLLHLRENRNLVQEWATEGELPLFE